MVTQKASASTNTLKSLNISNVVFNLTSAFYLTSNSVKLKTQLHAIVFPNIVK